ncbi:hypothetical protein IJ732_03315 [bacterium]|nr:hypothetical protein [bacterium]
MIESVSGQRVRPLPQRPIYGNVNIEIHMTPPQHAPVPPKYQRDDEHVCPNCGYYYDIPKVSVYTTEPQNDGSQKDDSKVSNKVLIYPQQTVIDKKDKVQEDKESKTPSAEKVTNPISNVKPKAIEIVKPNENILQAKQEKGVDDKKSEKASKPEIKDETKEPVAPKRIEIVKPKDLKPAIDINTIIAELANPDFARQADALSVVAQVAQASPEIGAQMLDMRVIETLLGIVNMDTSKLAAPTARQLQIRQAMLMGQPVTKSQQIEASVKAPVELAEDNKEMAMLALASMEKVYANEIEKMGGKVKSVNDLPGAKEIINEVGTNDNPHIRVTGLGALSYVQRPEYSAELQAVYQKATTDTNPVVRAVAQKAIELNA